MKIVTLITRFIFGDELSELPPAGSGREGDWDEKTFNRRLVAVVGKSKGGRIKEVDMMSKDKYDEMDGHIKQLRDIKEKLHERNREKARDRQRTPKPNNV